MQTKAHFQKIIPLLILFGCFQLARNKVCAQSRTAEIAEMKDTVNLIISSIRTLEKEVSPDQKQIDVKRTRLMELLIYNSTTQCGVMPAPSAKVEAFETYWKCLFDNALYGKKFILSY